MLEQSRGATSAATMSIFGTRRDDNYPEFRIGRIKHERIKVFCQNKMVFSNT